MNTTVEVIGQLGGIIIAIGLALYGVHKSPIGVWITYFGSMVFLLAVALFWHNSITEPPNIGSSVKREPLDSSAVSTLDPKAIPTDEDSPSSPKDQEVQPLPTKHEDQLPIASKQKEEPSVRGQHSGETSLSPKNKQETAYNEKETIKDKLLDKLQIANNLSFISEREQVYKEIINEAIQTGLLDFAESITDSLSLVNDRENVYKELIDRHMHECNFPEVERLIRKLSLYNDRDFFYKKLLSSKRDKNHCNG